MNIAREESAGMIALTRSYVHGASDIPLFGDTIGEHFDAVAGRWPDRQALVVRHQNIRWTYGDLKERVDAFAAGLVALGLEPGDRIGIWSPNNAEWVVTQFATAQAGLILVNINPAYRLAELEYALNKVDCRALITARSFKTSDYLGMLRELAPEIDSCAPGRLRSAKLKTLGTIIVIGEDAVPGMLPFAEVAAMGGERHRLELAERSRKLQFDDPINIQFTSGTTGFPKGATLTHHNILNNGFFIGEALRLSDRDRICIPVPLYHCFGMVLGNLACVTHGSAMIYPAEAFDAVAVLETVAAERCTGLYGVPTMFIAELDHPRFSEFDLSSLRTGIMAGSPCPIEVMKRVGAEMGISEMTIAFGMTETSPASTMVRPDDTLEHRCGTVGQAMTHTEIEIVDPVSERIVPRGEPGEFRTRGYLVMSGYWEEPERTAEAVDSAGWMHTGDLATMDADGYVRIVGRIKDMIIRGGENVYPREIEEFLYGHPVVADVPDERLGEEVMAWVIPREGATVDEDELRDYCRGKIARYKIPRYVASCSEFPMTVTGKIQKHELRAQAIEQL